MIQIIDYDLHILKLIWIKFHMNYNFLVSPSHDLKSQFFYLLDL